MGERSHNIEDEAISCLLSRTFLYGEAAALISIGNVNSMAIAARHIQFKLEI